MGKEPVRIAQVIGKLCAGGVEAAAFCGGPFWMSFLKYSTFCGEK